MCIILVAVRSSQLFVSEWRIAVLLAHDDAIIVSQLLEHNMKRMAYQFLETVDSQQCAPLS